MTDLKQKLQNLIDEYYYKSMDLGRNLDLMTDRESIIRDCLDKTISDLEELIKDE